MPPHMEKECELGKTTRISLNDKMGGTLVEWQTMLGVEGFEGHHTWGATQEGPLSNIVPSKATRRGG